MKQTHGRTRSRRVIGNVKLILVLLSIFLPASFLAAQQVQEFTGRVTDPSGAVLAKAMVIAHNVDSGVDTSTTTTSTGNYTIPYLIPGHYSISATAPGFETGVRTGLTLQVDQAATVNFALKVGSTTETVTVNADSLLDTAKADNGVVVENARVTELPLNGRNVGMLAVLAPGALFEGDSEYVKGGVKPDQWGGVKLDQQRAWKLLDLRGVWRLERSGRRHTPRGGLRRGGWVAGAAVRGWRDRACACSA